MSPTLRKLFTEVRRSPIGQCVSPSVPFARDAAVTLRKWDALESLGLVRLRSEHDADFNPDDYDCDFDGETTAEGSIGEFLSPDSARFYLDCDTFTQSDLKWVHGDSVWGHVGYRDVLDWKENVYILDVMAETIAAFRDAWKAQCPTCHGTGRV